MEEMPGILSKRTLGLMSVCGWLLDVLPQHGNQIAGHTVSPVASVLTLSSQGGLVPPQPDP